MSKIESAKIILKRHGYNPSDYGSEGLIEMIKEAQKQAREAAKEAVKNKAYGLHYEDAFDKNPTYVHVCEKCIDEIFDSEELKVL